MNSFVKRLAGLGIVGLSLIGCATGSSNDACPPVVVYSAAVLEKAAKEVEALPDGSVLVELLADYSVLRAQVRLCGGPR